MAATGLQEQDGGGRLQVRGAESSHLAAAPADGPARPALSNKPALAHNHPGKMELEPLLISRLYRGDQGMGRGHQQFNSPFSLCALDSDCRTKCILMF